MSVFFDFAADDSQVTQAAKRIGREIREMSDKFREFTRVSHDGLDESKEGLDELYESMKRFGALTIGGWGLKEFGGQVMKVRGEFQQLEVAFKTMLGDAGAANALMNQLVHTAAVTPFDLKGVADGAKQLMAYGVSANEVNDTLIHLGDIAAGLSLPLSDLVFLYGTTMTQGRMFTQDLRQFMGRGIPLADELAKQFGVAKEEVGNLVSAGKVGAEEFNKAIMSMSSEGGKFAGLMEAQSKTISGQISNLEDAIDTMFNEIGKNTENVISGGIEMTASLVENWQTVGAAILAVAEAVGIYKATLATMSAVDNAASNVGYNAEIAELSKIIPLKEEEANADLHAAVAEGKLTQSKAEQIAALRAEAAEQLKALTVKEAVAKKNYQMSIEQHLIAQRNMAVAQSQVKIAIESGTAEEIAAAKKGAATAKEELQTAAIAKNTAAKELNTASTQKNAISNGLDAAASAGATRATGVLSVAKLSLKRAIDMVNASFLASPVFWIAAAIAGVTFAIYKLVTAETAEERARRKANEQMEEFNKKIEEHKQNAESLINTIKDSTASEYQRLEAYERLKILMPSLTEKYTQAEIAELDLAKAQKQMNEEADKTRFDHVKAEIKKYEESIELLKKAMLDDALYNNGRNAMTYYIRIESNQAALDEAERRLGEILVLRKKLADESRPIEVRLEEAKENAEVREAIFDFYDKAMLLASRWQEANDSIDFSTGKSEADEFFEQTSLELDELKKRCEKNPYDIKLKLEYNEKQRIYNEMVAMRDGWQRSGLFNIPFTFTVDYQSAQKAANDARKKAEELGSQKDSSTTLQQDYTAARKAYKNAAAEVEKMRKNRSAYKKTDWETAQTNLKEAKQTFQDLGGDPDGKQTKKVNTERERALKERNKTQNELDKDLQELMRRNEEEVTALMTEGREKRLREICNEYERRKSEIERQEKEFREKNKNAGVKTGDKGLTEEQVKALAAARKNAADEQESQTKKIYNAELEAMREYLKEYGSFEQRRLAITEDYEERIRKAQSEGERMALEKEKEKVLSSMTFENISMGIDWHTLLSGVGTLSQEMMKPMLEQLEAYTNTAEYNTADIQEREKVTELIQELRRYIGTDHDVDWTMLVTATEDFSDSVARYKEAVQKEKEAVAALEKAKDGHNRGEISEEDFDKIENTARELGEKTVIARKDMQSLGKTLNETSENVKNYISPLTAALNKLGTWKGVEGFDAVNNNVASIDALKGALDATLPSMGNGMAKTIGSGLSSAIGSGLSSLGSGISSMLSSGLGSVIGIVAQIPRLILNLVDGIKNMVVGVLDSISELISLRWIDDLVNSILDAIGRLVETIFDLPENIYKVVSSIIVEGVGGLLGSILNTVTFGGFNSWFGSAGNSKAVAETTERLTRANERLTERVEELTEQMGKSSGMAAVKNYEDAREAQDAINKNVMEILRAQMSYTASHHSNNYYMDSGTIQELFAKAGGENIFKMAGVKGASVTDIGSFYDMSPEQLKAIKVYAPELWEYITSARKYDKSEYWDAAIEQAGKLEEITDAINENMTQMTFDSLRSSFVDTLMDMDKDASDFADDFSKYMTQAMLNFAFGEQLDGRLKEWYEKWSEAMQSNSMDDDELRAAREEYDAIVKEGLALRDSISSVTGYDKTSEYKQEASSKGWQSMGQDTAEELNGRFTALQISNDAIAGGVLSVCEQLSGIAAMNSGNNIYLQEVRNMMITGNSYLEDIAKYSKKMYADFLVRLDGIVGNTKGL